MDFPVADVEVACGVLVDGTGRVLIAQRPAGKIAAGKWEFPGGKIEDGESPRAALVRELSEELGVRVCDAEPLARLRQDYRERRVWLDTWRVTAFDGVPRPCEGQQLAWVLPGQVGDFDALPSCWRVLAALCLPPHYAFSPPDTALSGWLPRLPGLPAGTLLRLRRPGLSDTDYVAEARVLAAACTDHGLGLVLDRDPLLVETLDVAGWHATATALAHCHHRPLPKDRWCFASVHDAAGLQRSREVGMDAAVLSPVLSTPTHPGAQVLGWEGFRSLSAMAGLPVYALGGLMPDALPIARACGAFGVAGISAYWSSASRGAGAASSAGIA